MKIIFLVNSIKWKTGAVRVICVKANALAKIPNIEIGICQTLEQDTHAQNSAFTLDSKVKVSSIALKNQSVLKGILGKIISFFKLRRGLELFLKKELPDIVISTHNENFILGSINSKSKFIKIREIHTSSKVRKFSPVYNQYTFKARLLDFMELKILPWFYHKTFLLTQKDFYQNITTKLKHRFDVMRNPCTVEFISTDGGGRGKAIFSHAKKEKTVIAVGRLDYIKNFEGLLSIWKSIANHVHGWKLKIFGEGPMENILRNLIHDYKLESSVELCGFCSSIEHEFEKAAIFVMTSRSEGFGLVLLEALSRGVPVVSYDLPYGPGEIIKNGNTGFVVPHNDEKSFADKLLFLINNPQIRLEMGQRALQDIKYYDPSLIANEWIEKYESLLEKIKKGKNYFL